MQKKEWSEPTLEALNIKMTKWKTGDVGGGHKGSGSHPSGASHDDSCPDDVGFES